MSDMQPRPHRRRILSMTLLMLGALVFLFPFYYMVIGALQTKRDPSLSGAIPWPSNLTLNNFLDINGAINLGRSLLNSGIFTGVVVVCTIFFGVLAGYALATLHFRGRGLLFAVVLLLQAVPEGAVPPQKANPDHGNAVWPTRSQPAPRRKWCRRPRRQ